MGIAWNSVLFPQSQNCVILECPVAATGCWEGVGRRLGSGQLGKFKSRLLDLVTRISFKGTSVGKHFCPSCPSEVLGFSLLFT